MRKRRISPNTRTLTIIAQDPSIRINGRILTSTVQIPAEELSDGPRGYRVSVVDYDATANVLYGKAAFPAAEDGHYKDPFGIPERFRKSRKHLAKREKRLIEDPRFHAQNVYAIVMRILARFEFALGRRVAWGCDGHQLHIAPHAFAEANAFYSREDRGLFFGYFAGRSGKPVFTCLAHDVVAHETTHALLDGLRRRYLEPSSPDQAAFHEGFADIVAILSIFSLQDVVSVALAPLSAPNDSLIAQKHLTREAIQGSILLGLAKQLGDELSRVRGDSLRRSVALPPNTKYLALPEYQEPHRRGEVVVAAVLRAFVDIWLARLEKVGFLKHGQKDRSLVVEEGARVAEHLLTMAIRAIDYSPPTDIDFSDFLSALLTVDKQVVPDDSKFGYRDALIRNFASYGIDPAGSAHDDGTWLECRGEDFAYTRTHFESMMRDKEEVFRFVWENRKALAIVDDGYVEIESVRPCIRVGPDGFMLRETVAEYVQILTLTVGELKPALGIDPPDGMPKWRRVRLFGGGALIFDEYGRLKYQIRNRLENAERQTARLKYLWETGYYDRPADDKSPFAALHLARATA